MHYFLISTAEMEMVNVLKSSKTWVSFVPKWVQFEDSTNLPAISGSHKVLRRPLRYVAITKYLRLDTL
jgi:hypothetical protein